MSIVPETSGRITGFEWGEDRDVTLPVDIERDTVAAIPDPGFGSVRLADLYEADEWLESTVWAQLEVMQ